MRTISSSLAPFTLCNVTTCIHHDGGGCSLHMIDVVKRSLGGGRTIVTCADYEERKCNVREVDGDLE